MVQKVAWQRALIPGVDYFVLSSATKRVAHLNSFHRAIRFIIGGITASTIASLYYLAPALTFASIVLASFRPSLATLAVVALLAALIFAPSQPNSSVRRSWPFQCLAEYFQAEVVAEFSKDAIKSHDKAQRIVGLIFPHGVISFGGFCLGTLVGDLIPGLTAAASAVLWLPFVRNLIGCWGLVNSSRGSLDKTLRNNSDVFIYPGGISEMFHSNFDNETIYFKHRLGCIRVAVDNNADIVPVYIFGNTRQLKIVGCSAVAIISRRLRIAITLFWGLLGLPIPHPEKTIIAIGQPLKRRPNEGAEDFHRRVQADVARLFNKFKVLHPNYAEKDLHII